jgi:hypothetical protein
MPETYFVTLPNTGITLNIASIVLIEWQNVPMEWERQGYTATVQLANRTCLYVDNNDVLVLQNAIYEYNYVSGREHRNRVQHTQTKSKVVFPSPQVTNVEVDFKPQNEHNWTQVQKNK